MVLYFTGTGNSYYAARRIAKVLGDELLSMNERIRSEDTSPVEGSSWPERIFRKVDLPAPLAPMIP